MRTAYLRTAGHLRSRKCAIRVVFVLVGMFYTSVLACSHANSIGVQQPVNMTNVPPAGNSGVCISGTLKYLAPTHVFRLTLTNREKIPLATCIWPFLVEVRLFDRLGTKISDQRQYVERVKLPGPKQTDYVLLKPGMSVAVTVAAYDQNGLIKDMSRVDHADCILVSDEVLALNTKRFAIRNGAAAGYLCRTDAIRLK